VKQWKPAAKSDPKSAFSSEDSTRSLLTADATSATLLVGVSRIVVVLAVVIIASLFCMCKRDQQRRSANRPEPVTGELLTFFNLTLTILTHVAAAACAATHPVAARQ
jgi:hypothetical protein